MAIYKNKKNGKWYARGCVNHQRYHRHLEGVSGKTEANEMDAVIRREISLRQRGLLKEEEKRHKLSEGIALWHTASKKNVDYEHDKKMIEVIEAYFKADKTYLDEITMSKATAFQTYVWKDMSNSRTKKKGHAPATANRYVAKLRKVMSLSVQEGYISTNPLKNLEDLEENNERQRYLEPDEEERLFKALAKHLKPIVYIELRTGLRRGKVLQLKWQDVNFKSMTIKVVKIKKGKPVPTAIPLSQDAKKCLLSLPHLSEYVFTNPKTGTGYTTISKGFSKALERAKIEDFRFHDLRHTVGSRMIDNGVSMRTIQEQLGHSSITTTERYTHPTNEARIEAVNGLDTYAKDNKNNTEVDNNDE